MHKSEYSSIDSTNGNVSWKGPLSVEKGDHSGMPPRTDAYLPGDEKGHVNASSLAGDNSEANVVAQNKDLNHGGYLSIERGERDALQNGADIYSEKTAIVDSQPGDRPSTFIVNDTVTYADGHSENIYNSFTNESNANQVEWNDIFAKTLLDTFCQNTCKSCNNIGCKGHATDFEKYHGRLIIRNPLKKTTEKRQIYCSTN